MARTQLLKDSSEVTKFKNISDLKEEHIIEHIRNVIFWHGTISRFHVQSLNQIVFAGDSGFTRRHDRLRFILRWRCEFAERDSSQFCQEYFECYHQVSTRKRILFFGYKFKFEIRPTLC